MHKGHRWCPGEACCHGGEVHVNKSLYYDREKRQWDYDRQVCDHCGWDSKGESNDR